MKILYSQRGHDHIFLIMLAVITLVGAVGFTVQSKQSANLHYAAAALPSFNSCDDILNVTEEQEDAMTDAEYEAYEIAYDTLCGSDETEEGDLPVSTTAPIDQDPVTDPSTAIDPCDAIPDEEYYKMTNEELTRICGYDMSGDDEETDDGQDPDAGQNLPSSTKGDAKVNIALASTSACVDNTSKLTFKAAKAYGNERIKNRKNTLSAQNKKLSKEYSSSKVSANLKLRQTVANKQLKASAKKHSKKTPAQIRVSKPTNHSKQIKSQIKASNKVLTASAKKLKSSKTAPQAAKASCAAIFDSQIYSYVLPKIVAQKRIDSLYAQNAAYDINYKLATKISKMRGKPNATAKLTNPTVIKNRIDSLQNSLNGINAQTLASNGNNSAYIANSTSPIRKDIKASIKASSIAAKKSIKVLR